MKNLLITLLAVLLLPFLFANEARARIEIDISSAELRKVPVAVPYFIDLDDPAKKEQAGIKMAALLSKALEFHGFISIIPPASYDGSQQHDWLVVGSDFTVIGKYRHEKDNKLLIEIRLIDITTGRMILGRRYRGGATKLRTMLLKFSDLVVKKMTGEPGVSRTEIAFVSEKNGVKEIYLTDIFGDNLRQITKHQKLAVSPRFTPDGKALSYTSYHRGNPNLYLTDLSQDKITTPISQRKGLNMAPAWAPDGKTMVITLSAEENPDLYLIDLEGNILERLTRNKGINVSPAWSPDGKSLVFVSDRNGTPQIYVMDLETKDTRRITFVGNYNTSPAWSPRGDLIAYSGHHEGTYHIFAIPPEGGRPTRITRRWGDHESPSWSPDGRQITFSRKRGEEQKICTIFRNGAGLRVLFDWDGNESLPQWSPRPAD
ncbi:MAG: Tol-Pal system beta propeller repeat protein TolB [Thermodesulfobacteriota bacterium]